MTNFEKYRTELKELNCGVDFKINFEFNFSKCEDCESCIFHENDNCSREKLNWLYRSSSLPKITKKEKKFLEVICSDFIMISKINNTLFFIFSFSYFLFFPVHFPYYLFTYLLIYLFFSF